MTTTDNLPALNRAEKNVLRQFEAEIAGALENANRYGAIIGKALWDISDEQLYRDTHATFAEYVEDRWQMSTSKAYRLIKIAKEHAAHPELPIPSQYALEGRKNAPDPQRPNLGTVATATPESSVPEVIDAEGWEEPEPKALLAPAAVASELYQAPAPDSPGATIASQPEVRAGLTAPGGEGDPTEADINDAAWNSADVVKPSEMTRAEYDAWTTKLHDEAKARLDAEHPKSGLTVTEDGRVSGYFVIREANGVPISPAEQLIDLLTSVDLDAIGTEMIADQMDTLTRAYEQIRESWTVTHKARKDWSKELRARRPVGNAPVASRSSAPLGRREVTTMFKDKAKVG